ncbi:SRPBCC family protein [Flavobacterium selenitireducens]|uniref:SRPBCC family protein n=1 Tax=Flavobacterium selenitireducens TaxID=2722704 RepID=UPI00168AD366|nr:SRPBCC domain-containing protein [Flavobacterium selenitireducens]MBD3583975.1 SRPBCC domain-containing protein [Flavobacterium selenitireducens]
MQNFDWTQFTLRIAIKCDLKTVYDAWTIPFEVEKWFLRQCDYLSGGHLIDKNDAAAEGNSYCWKWFLYSETETGEIRNANGSDMFSFTFAGNCLVEIRLSDQHEHTLVELTQSNIPTDEASKKNIRLGCHNGWSFYLVNLKSVCEGGLDLRGKDNRFTPFVNN